VAQPTRLSGRAASHRAVSLAIRYPTRRDLAKAVRRVLDAGVPLQGVADHGVSESIYLADLDGNGIELTRDRPEVEWPRDAQGTIAMHMADPLDLEALLKEAD
jgi:catechol 2,3-dioxygenase